MDESGRLTHSEIQNLSNLKVDDYSALVIPGGMGTAKNFCNYIQKGKDFAVDPMIEKILKDFIVNRRAMAFCCLVSIIPASVFGTKYGGPGIKLTVGKQGPSWIYTNLISIFCLI